MSGSETPERTANEIYLDAVLRHQIDLRRYSSGEIRDIRKLLLEADKDLVALLRTRLSELGLPASRDDVTVRRLRSILTDLRVARAEALEALRDEFTQHADDAAALEAERERTLLEASIGIQITVEGISLKTAHAIVANSPFQGQLLKDWFSQLTGVDAQRLERAISLGVINGETVDQIIRRVVGTRAGAYQDGVLSITRRNAEAIVRTAINHISNEARSEVWDANPDIVSEEMWVATLDGRTTPYCQAMDGKVFPVNEGPRPPAHFNCLPGDCLIAPIGEVSAVTKRRYKGDLVVIRTVSGYELPISPNHPVMTDRGWVSACLLDTTYSVVRDMRGELPLVGESEGQNVISTIEEFAGAFFEASKSVLCEVKTTSIDFHGDATDGEVCVIGTHGGLPPIKDQSPLFHHSSKLSLALRDKNAALFPGSGCECQLGLTSDTSADCVVGGSSVGGALGSSKTSHPSDISLRDLFVFSRLPEPSLAGLFAGSDGDVLLFQDPEHRQVAHSETLADITSALAGQIAFDNIVFVGKRKFSGHVYNLETSSGYYTATAGRIIVHNCRSVMVAVLNLIGIIGDRPYVTDTRRPGKRRIDFRSQAKDSAGTAWSGMSTAERNAAIAKVRNAWGEANIGRVPASTTYQQWLSQQDAAFQDKVLGKTKGKLFRDGGLQLTQFVDRAGNELTLVQLKALYPEEWARALG